MDEPLAWQGKRVRVRRRAGGGESSCELVQSTARSAVGAFDDRLAMKSGSANQPQDGLSSVLGNIPRL